MCNALPRIDKPRNFCGESRWHVHGPFADTTILGAAEAGGYTFKDGTIASRDSRVSHQGMPLGATRFCVLCEALDRLDENYTPRISQADCIMVMVTDDSDGVASYQGYEYQILATVWLSLELMVGRKNCPSIVVEPASGEDVAANLDVPSEDVASKVVLGLMPQSIEVQIKLRQTDQWTSAKFQEVVRGNRETTKSGAPATRIRPIEQLLALPTTRFVLLTNAQVNRDLRPFLIERLGDNSAAVEIPGEAVLGESPQTAQRVAILQQQHSEVLRARIDTLLQKAGVPYSERRACATKLQEEVRSRLLRIKPPTFSQNELFALLRAFDGLPAQDPGKYFVAPSNFEEMTERLENEHRLAIVGAPGMGKTLAAQELVRRHRVATDAFKVVTEAAGPGEIAKWLEQPGRYLFFLEDPWGQFKLSADADRWATALPKLLPRASSDKRFLITTRTAIQNTAYASRIPQELSAIQSLLNQSNYTVAHRREILERAVASAAPWQRDFVQQYREQILRSLTAPYSLTLFATMLMRAKSDKDVQLVKLIHDCNVEVIGSTVAAEIQALGRETVASTIALWAWTMARRKVNMQDANDLRRTIRDGGFSGDIDVRKLLTYLAQAQWFREHDGEYSTHPAILEGLELVAAQEPGLAEEVLSALLKGLAKQDRGNLAYRIRKSLTDRQLPLPPRVQKAIDSHLLSRLKETSGYDFTVAFDEAATDCRSSEPLAILARALRVRPSQGGLLDYEPWKSPDLTETDIHLIKDSAEAREFAEKFVRTMLSSESAAPYNAFQLESFFSQFGWDLADDYLVAVEEGLERDNFYVEAAVNGSIAVDEPPFERIIDAALRHYDAACTWWKESQETVREARQAEMDADYANHIEEQPQERFAPSRAVLKVLVGLRIRQQGYDWLLKHPRRDDLLEAWAESVTPSTSLPEMQALAEACRPSHLNVFFDAAEKSKNKQLGSAILELMLSDGGSVAAGSRALMSLLTSEEMAQLIGEAASSLTLVRRLELADGIVTARSFDMEVASAKMDRAVSVLLGAQERELWEATDPDRIGKAPLPAEDAEFLLGSLRTIAESSTSETLAVRAVFLLAAWGQEFAVYLPRLLASESSEIRLNALRLLARHGDTGSRARLRTALADEDYRCRREAMTLLAQDATEAEKQYILALARDRSGPVRERCALIIQQLEWDDAQPILYELLKDRRSNQHGVGLFRGQFPSFHVARAAARALDTFTDKVHVSAVQAVKTFLEERHPEKDDPFVHYYALQFLGGIQSPEIIVMLVDYLSDDWHVDGMKREGFPLRYVAAWGLLTQLLNDNSVADAITIDALYEAARHHDPRLAGPSLICLGLCGHRATGQVVQLCNAGVLSINRAALLRLALALADIDPPNELANILAKHPVESIIEAARSELVLDEVSWTRFRETNPNVQEWVSMIQSSDDVSSVLRLALHELFDGKIEDQLSRADIRAGELPESLPVMNLRTMTGGE